MYSYQTRTATQTATQAKRLASRIGAELLQVTALYPQKGPSDEKITDFVLEAELYLAAGYLDHVRYGFKRDGLVVFELVYTADQASGIDDKPGRVPPGCDLTGGTWFSYLVQNEAWSTLTDQQREQFRSELPFRRSSGEEPRLAPGVYARGTKQFSEDTLGLRREVRAL